MVGQYSRCSKKMTLTYTVALIIRRVCRGCVVVRSSSTHTEAFAFRTMKGAAGGCCGGGINVNVKGQSQRQHQRYYCGSIDGAVNGGLSFWEQQRK